MLNFGTSKPRVKGGPGPPGPPLDPHLRIQYKLLYTDINIRNYDEPLPRTKKILHRAVKFEAGEENRIIFESLY